MPSEVRLHFTWWENYQRHLLTWLGRSFGLDWRGNKVQCKFLFLYVNHILARSDQAMQWGLWHFLPLFGCISTCVGLACWRCSANIWEQMKTPHKLNFVKITTQMTKALASTADLYNSRSTREYSKKEKRNKQKRLFIRGKGRDQRRKK